MNQITHSVKFWELQECYCHDAAGVFEVLTWGTASILLSTSNATSYDVVAKGNIENLGGASY